jgi:hypothetical protein
MHSYLEAEKVTRLYNHENAIVMGEVRGAPPFATTPSYNLSSQLDSYRSWAAQFRAVQTRHSGMKILPNGTARRGSEGSTAPKAAVLTGSINLLI